MYALWVSLIMVVNCIILQILTRDTLYLDSSFLQSQSNASTRNLHADFPTWFPEKVFVIEYFILLLYGK